MIKSLCIQNFKSFKDTGEVVFTPLTLLTGQNSSGKSTLVQALLVLKQTIESPFSNEPLILNGSYVSLGNFTDIIYSGNINQNVKIEIKLGFPKTPYTSDDDLVFFYNPLERSNILQYVDLAITFAADTGNNDSITNIFHLIHASLRGSINNERFELSVSKDNKLLESLKTQFDLEEEQSFADSSMLFSVNTAIKCRKPQAIGMNKFLPSYALSPFPKQRIDEQRKFIYQFIKMLCDTFNLSHIFKQIGRKKQSLDYWLRLIMSNIKSFKQNIDEVEVNRLLTQLDQILTEQDDIKNIDVRNNLQFVLSRITLDSLSSLKKMLDDGLIQTKSLEKSKDTLIRHPIHFINLDIEDQPNIDMGDINVAIFSIFNKIYYLGPLREEPKVFYRRLGSSDPMYVGQRGENVAFVLKYYSSKKINAIVPEDGAVDIDFKSIKPIQCSLAEALARWIKYLGIATEIKVEEMGKIGLTIRANIHGDKESDLTNVGVGVSQVLPLIVLGLASPKRAILIFEQPELHLHPYVQSRLGDFFLSLTKIGKQVIAETHSEHIINRIRYFTALDVIKYGEDTIVFFIKRDDSNKCSEIIKIDIDRYGAVNNWPKGFFDETSKSLDSILMAALERD